MRIFNALLASLVILYFTSACSTMVEDSFLSNQEVLVESIPSESDIYMNGDFIGKTPMTLTLPSDISHEIYFEKEGFKPTKEYLDPIYKEGKQPYVQFGFAKDLGYYYQLSRDHVIAELYWEHLPSTAGIMPFDSMSDLITKADNAMSSGDLSLDEHKIIIRQIIEMFNSK
jgi:hypothetical protein